ncbi:hypothetical protein VNI00_003029 [Paramarasmius palmivorus]|uniref:F-box domain-containing protein n=1 Tax=Paramarasmius palmivorus TaxID=297713 RepID=A0AAW0DV43_9AGAR
METPIQPPPPALEALLYNNELPPHSVRLACRGELLAIDRRLATIADELREMEQRAARLREEESRLNSYKPTYQRILNPVRGFPDEILTEIFTLANSDVRNTVPYFMSPDMDGQFFDTLDTTRPPWTLGQVCQSWRAVATTTPSLWRTLRIQMPSTSSSAHEKRIKGHRLATFLSRSRNLPLNVELKSYYAIAPDDLVLFTLFNDQLGDALHTISAHVRSDVGVLRSLFLDIHGHAVDGRVFDAFANAPNLQRVTIRGLSPDLYAALQIPWVQITHFRRLKRLPSHSRTSPTSAEHLAHMSDIVEYHDVDFVCPPGPNIHIPHLQTLIIVIPSSLNPETSIRLDRLVMGDSFTEFQVGNSDPNVWIPTPPHEPHEQVAVMTFIRRWRETLRSLSLCIWSVRPWGHHFVSLLSVLQHLESLSLFFGMSFPSTLVRSLADPAQIQTFLPRLKCILFFGWLQKRSEREELIGMLEARSRADSSLRLVGFPAFQDETGRSAEEILGEIQRRGLPVKPIVPENWRTESLPSTYRQCL